MIRRLLLRGLPADWRDVIEGDLLESTRYRRFGRIWLLLHLTVIVARFAAARLGERWTPGRRWRASRLLDDAWSDVRYGIRRWRARPGLTLTAIATIALGIGTTSALFSIVDGVLLKPLPYPQPDRLVSITRTYPEWLKDPMLSAGWDRISLSYPEFFQVRERSRTLQDLAVVTTQVSVVSERPAAEIRVGVVSASFFRVLGARPTLGTLFEPGDDLDDTRTIVISHDLWRSRYGAHPAVIGTVMRLRDGDRTIRGVLPANFRWGTRQLPYQAWIPLSAVSADGRAHNNRNLGAVGRLRPGVSLDQCRDEMSGLLREVFRFNSPTGAAVTPLLQQQLRRVQAPLLILLAGAVLLLILACANVAGLVSGDAASRDGEMAVRGSLGATTSRVLRQLLVEGGLLAGAGAAAGLLIASWTIRGLVALAPLDLPRAGEIALDGRVVAVAAVAAAATAILCALLPLVGISRGRWRLRPRAATRTTTARARTTTALTAIQVAIGVGLLAVAGLFARTIQRLEAVDTGFDPAGVLTLRGSLPPSGADTPARATRYFAEARAALSQLPGVTAAAISSGVPLGSGRSTTTLTLTDPPPGQSASFEAQRRFVSPEYLEVTKMVLLEGRWFASTDHASAQAVTVLTREMARRLWPEGAVGRTLTYAGVVHRIIGVVKDTRDVTLYDGPRPTFYLSTLQRPAWSSMYLLVRTQGDPLSLAPMAREALTRIDPDVPVEDIRPLDAVFIQSIDDERYRAVLMMTFAGAATALAAVGLYGVLSRRVAERRREIGVRLALGARPSQVRRLFVAEGIRLALAGAALGVPLAVALGRAAASLLFEVQPTDAATLALVTSIVAAVCLVASYVPSVRASRLDPAGIFRSD